MAGGTIRRVLSSILLTTAAGAVAGGFGSVLGLGGGFILVPFFEFVLGLPFVTATGLSLMTIVGNSVSVSATPEGREMVNTRLAMVVQILTVAGAVAGTTLLRYDWYRIGSPSECSGSSRCSALSRCCRG